MSSGKSRCNGLVHRSRRICPGSESASLLDQHLLPHDAVENAEPNILIHRIPQRCSSVIRKPIRCRLPQEWQEWQSPAITSCHIDFALEWVDGSRGAPFIRWAGQCALVSVGGRLHAATLTRLPAYMDPLP
jgi:hypothetical protein